MKNFYLMLLSLIIIFSACKKNDNSTPSPVATVTYDKINKPILIDFSGTSNSVCGTYGGPAFDSIIHLEPSTISGMEVCKSSSPPTMNSNLADSIMYSDFSIVGFPDFFINTTPESSGGGCYATTSENYNWALGNINTFAALPVTAAIQLSQSISGSTMKVSSNVKFYIAQDVGKDFRLAIYIVEDNVKVSQDTETGIIANYNYRNLLRTGNTSSYKGDPLNNSNAITENQEFSKSYNISLNGAWVIQNLKVIAVIWNVPSSGGLPSVVNTNILL